MRRRERGFTAIDLIVAIAVAALVSYAAFPAVGEIYDSYMMRNAVDQIRFEIMRARMQASAQSRFVRLRIDTSGALVREQSDDGQIFEAKVAPKPLPRNTDAYIHGPPPQFSPAGLSSGWSVIALRGRSTTKYLIVNPLGKVYSE